MSNIQQLLSQRLKKKELSTKMAEMAEKSASGKLSGFSGIFSIVDLTDEEKAALKNILHLYQCENERDESYLDSDLTSLISITSEIKAINNQAAILHGERIKRAHTILTKYRDGAFSSWLVITYGNRQTPYNFMQYYEFYELAPAFIKALIEKMPRQAIYTLASRDGGVQKKYELIEKHSSRTKNELLDIIREQFPLDESDKRAINIGATAVKGLRKIYCSFSSKKLIVSREQKDNLTQMVEELRNLIDSMQVIDDDEGV